jgi:outer membrane biosynthesis protein TonB
MKTINRCMFRLIAITLAVLLGTPLGALAQQNAQTQNSQDAKPATVDPRPIPAQPATSTAEVAALPDSPAPAPQNEPAPQQQQPAPQSNAQQQQNAPSQPMGTAAAPAEPAGGVAATRPAGAAIAPGKQKRSHTLLIRWTLIIGAAVAVGTVVGLSSASPSRP